MTDKKPPVTKIVNPSRGWTPPREICATCIWRLGKFCEKTHKPTADTDTCMGWIKGA